MTILEYLVQNQTKLFKINKYTNLHISKVSDRDDLINFIIFFGDNYRPTYFLKVSRNIKTNNVLKNEYQNHRHIYDFGKPIADKLSKPIFFDSNWRFAMLCLEFKNIKINYLHHLFRNIREKDNKLPKSKFKNLFLGNLKRDKVEVDIWVDACVNFLTEFNKPKFENKERLNIEALIEVSLKYLSKNNVQKNIKIDVIKQILLKFKKQAKSIKKIKLKPIHGDFNHYNIFLKNESIIILDWQDSHLNSNPIRDVMYLILNMILAFSDFKISKVNIKEIYEDNSYLSNSVDKICFQFAKIYNLEVSYLYILIGISAIDMKINDHRNTDHALRTCPLYKKNILVSFSQLFLLKAFNTK